ncbi:hypothetical protein X975_25960, partial [Stegodyphus mimosarum]
GKFHPLITDISSLNSDSRIILLQNGSLNIFRVSKEDEGVYQCSVSNDVGAPLKKSASLRVIGEGK